MRVTVVSTPSEHSTGKDSPPCTCKGRKGEAISDGLIAVVRFDGGSRAGIPWANLRNDTNSNAVSIPKEVIK